MWQVCAPEPRLLSNGRQESKKQQKGASFPPARSPSPHTQGAFVREGDAPGESQLCLVTEFMDGGSLQAAIQHNRVSWWRNGKRVSGRDSCMHRWLATHAASGSRRVLVELVFARCCAQSPPPAPAH